MVPSLALALPAAPCPHPPPPHLQIHHLPSVLGSTILYDPKMEREERIKVSTVACNSQQFFPLPVVGCRVCDGPSC